MVIRRGRLGRQRDGEELTGAAEGGSLVRSADDGALAERLRRTGAEVEPAETGLRVAGATAEQVGQLALTAGIALIELRPAVAELEDVFLELTAGGGIG
jgi:ABC-2 type transport system ATP-binding protein